MAAKAKASSSSCLSFLKEALLLPTRNAKLFVPVFLLVAVPSFLLQLTDVLYIRPLSTDIFLRVNEAMNMDPSSADYAKLMVEIMKEVRELLILSISGMVFAVVDGFANQTVAFFAASTTYSGESYSLPELFSKVIMKGRHLRGPLITIATVGALEVASVVLLVALLQLVVSRLGVMYMMPILVVPLLALLYLAVVFAVAVAVSVADAERRGVSALQQAWRLMTRVRGKQGCLLVVVVYVLGMVPYPLHAAGLACWKKSVPAGLALLSACGLLSGLVQLFYYSAAMVYYYQAKEEMAAEGYIKIPAAEATTGEATA